MSGDTEVLREKARSAWIALRAQTPALACRGFREADGDKRFAFRYSVPQCTSDVDAWVNETVFFDSHPSELYAKHRALKDGHWWRSSDNRYVAELHAAPLINGEEGAQWSFQCVPCHFYHDRGVADIEVYSIVFAHNGIDGRNAFTMLDSFLSLLSSEISGTALPTNTRRWGDETAINTAISEI